MITDVISPATLPSTDATQSANPQLMALPSDYAIALASNQGDYFFWRKYGPDPDRWPAVVFTRNGDWWEHEGGMLSLLVGLIDGSVEHKGLPPRPGPNPTVEVMMRAPDNQG